MNKVDIDHFMHHLRTHVLDQEMLINAYEKQIDLASLRGEQHPYYDGKLEVLKAEQQYLIDIISIVTLMKEENLGT